MAEETTKKPIYKKWWVWVIGVVILAAIGAGQGEKGDNVVANKSTNKEIKPISVTIGELLSAYEGNEVGADVKYKGKYIKPGDKLPKTSKIELICGNGNIPESARIQAESQE